METRTLAPAVKRNLARFPDDFMFQLTATEWAALRSHSVISKPSRCTCRSAPVSSAHKKAGTNMPAYKHHMSAEGGSKHSLRGRGKR
ncbi:MAG: ORF6N domain-containing protein [Proteobacteria bacterium]|nr:ORF6N domain-containing protein [Pseudomonadota bacterium]